MKYRVYRSIALALASISLMLAVRDATGIHDVDAVSSLLPRFHDQLWGVIRIGMLFVAAIVSWWGAEKRSARALATGLLGLSLNNNWWFLSLENPLLLLSVALNYLGLGFGLASLLRFTTSFGDATAERIDRFTRWLAPALGSGVALFGGLWAMSVLAFHSPLGTFDRLFWLCWDAFNILLVGISIVLYLRSAPSYRTQFGLMSASLVIAASGTALHGLLRFTLGDTIAANNIDTIAQSALPIGLGYSVLRQNAFGLKFYVNRAAVGTLLGLFLSFLFGIAEDVSNGWLKAMGSIGPLRALSSPALELAASAVVVVAFQRVEKNADQLVDRIKGDPGAATAPRDPGQ